MLVLPAAMLWLTVTGTDEVTDKAAAVKGPRPVPLLVPEARTAPFEVALILKLNWSAAAARAPLICVLRRSDANLTANIAPCNPPPTIVATTVPGLVEPTM